MKILWQIGSILSLGFALVANFLVGAQVLDVPAISDVSDKYATLLTPAAYAFSIWSLIYALLVVFAVYQARDILHKSTSNMLPNKIGLLFIVSSLCNGLWTYVFVREWVLLSVIVLLVLTVCLYAIIWRARIGTGKAKKAEIICVWWPIQIYTGWVTVASVVNIASWLRYEGYTMPAWICSVVLIALGATLLWLLRKQNLRELLLASSWGIAAVGAEQAVAHHGNGLVMWTAFCVAAVLVGASMYQARSSKAALPKILLRAL